MPFFPPLISHSCYLFFNVLLIARETFIINLKYEILLGHFPYFLLSGTLLDAALLWFVFVFSPSFSLSLLLSFLLLFFHPSSSFPPQFSLSLSLSLSFPFPPLFLSYSSSLPFFSFPTSLSPCLSFPFPSSHPRPFLTPSLLVSYTSLLSSLSSALPSVPPPSLPSVPPSLSLPPSGYFVPARSP